jgi:hypothetical protein
LEQTSDLAKELVDRAETRYRDAYRKADFLVGMGTTLKVLAALIGLIIVIAGLIAGSNVRTNPYGGYDTAASGIAGLSGFIMGGIVFAIGFVCGVLVSAQGQMLRASLDSAVHSSPFLDLPAKARAMGLAPMIAPRLSESDRKAIANLQKNWPGYS